MEIRNYGKVDDVVDIPNLIEIQIESYRDFLQEDIRPEKRKNKGLEAVLRETFPIENYDKTMSLDYIKYELGRPRYTPDECRKLRLTYGMPFKIWVRLNKGEAGEAVEEEVYLGEIPKMFGGGEFIINGAERVIVTQLHRSPGVDFLVEMHSEKRLHSCRIIPERGSWIELNVTKKDTLAVRIDQSGKFPATSFLRAMSEDYSTNADIIRLFHDIEEIDLSKPKAATALEGKHIVGEIIDDTGQAFLAAGEKITKDIIPTLLASGLEKIEVISNMNDPLILNSLAEDNTSSHEDALKKIYMRLRPGNPPQLDKAKVLFNERFFDVNRYRLGKVARFRINRKFGENTPEEEMCLKKEDFVNAIRYILSLRRGEGTIDDIDHLGNRRLRTINELAGEEFRKGFLKLKRTVQERMSLKDPEQLTPRTLINSKTVSSAIEYFFGRGELSQVVDQINPLSQLQHERRLSALGPGGLNRKRAGFEVRDVHISHYGRICPIETPEGTNIGLIASLGIYATLDEYGFLTTPYRKVVNGRVTDEIVYLRADEEDNHYLATPNVKIGKDGKIISESVLARHNGDFRDIPPKQVEYMDVSPKQLIGVSASLIPFLEHNDANRALMGSNMQRQAVPLLVTEPPIVATGMEKTVAQNSSLVVRSDLDGIVKNVAANRIVISTSKEGGLEKEYLLRKFVGLNDGTCLNQKPIVREGQKVKKGQIIADGAATSNGELALGRNVLVAFMTWDGYNFEDAVLVSESLLKNDKYTSIHIEEFEIEIRETKLGREEFTRDIPNVSERALRNLDDDGIIKVGTKVGPGDILVGKIAPKTKSELSPEEKLLHAIFGRAGEDVKNDSLEVSSGTEGIVIGAEKFCRKAPTSEDKRTQTEREVKRIESEYKEDIAKNFRQMIDEIKSTLNLSSLKTISGGVVSVPRNIENIIAAEEAFDPENLDLPKRSKDKAWEISRSYLDRINQLKDEKDRRINQLRRGDELPSGVLELVKVYIATKRTLAVGDKMAGRHGNKGVIARILPDEDMPFLKDGTPIEILLNPLGVPSRMNIGQILETHLGWAAKVLGFQAVTPVFSGATEEEIHATLKEANLPEDGKVTLYDGRTGEPFDQKVTVGYIYMMKLHHLVDDKVHARATGPYSLITQQPLGGKARFGGQRFGEMEVWALEAYGAAYILQELLTVKSDDVEGRTKIYESMVKGENTLEAGTPVSFDVLTNEIRGLGLNMQLEKKKI